MLRLARQLSQARHRATQCRAFFASTARLVATAVLLTAVRGLCVEGTVPRPIPVLVAGFAPRWTGSGSQKCPVPGIVCSEGRECGQNDYLAAPFGNGFVVQV